MQNALGLYPVLELTNLILVFKNKADEFSK